MLNPGAARNTMYFIRNEAIRMLTELLTPSPSQQQNSKNGMVCLTAIDIEVRIIGYESFRTRKRKVDGSHSR